MAVGLDLGKSQVRVIELERVGKDKYRFVGGGTRAHQLEIGSERAAEIKEVKKFMSDLWKQTRVTTNHVHMALPEEAVFTRVLKLPSLSDNELNSALKFELEQYIPLPVEKVYYSFVRLGKVKEKKGFKELVFVAAVPKERVDRLLRFTTELGLVVEVLETSMTAIARAASFNRENPVLVIDMGYSQFSMGVVKKGKLYISQKLELSGMALTRLLSRTLNVDEAQAEQVKRQYGLNKKQFNGKVADILLVAINQLVDEAKRMIAFFEDKVIAEKVKEVVLVGGGAVMPDLAGYLSDKLGIEVGIPIISSNLIEALPKEVSQQFHLYIQAVGLAMRLEE